MERFVKLFSVIHRQSSIRIDRKLKEYRIIPGQYLYIMFVCENAGFSQEQISSELQIDKGSVARTIKKLEADGYVSRSVSNDDKRTLQVYPTDKAKATYIEVEKIADAWEQVLIKDLSPIEVDILRNLLNKVKGNIGRY